jgi:outer membrane receptor for ferrienterochelin and colicin
MHTTAVKNFYIRMSFFIAGVLLLLFFCNSISAQQMATAKPGRVAGIVRDEGNNPISGVSITLTKGRSGTVTNVSGEYVFVLPPGMYTIIFSAIGYEKQHVDSVAIKSSEQTDLSLTLIRNKKDTLGAVKVVAMTARKANINGFLQAQKNAPGLQDGISAEQMAKVPDNNIAKVLKRVSGLTVQNEKFVTVRGISDRYVNAMINGSILPSTEPNRRNFSFDIVPAALIDNVVVNKTATPDLSGEFTGGIVQIFTKDVPVKNFLQVTIGTGINTASTGEDFISMKRDSRANWGKVDNDRKYFGDGRLLDPAIYLQAFRRNDTAFVRSVNSKIPNGNAWQRHSYGYTPVQSYQLSGGLSKRFDNGNSIGTIAAITYQNEQLSEQGILNVNTSGNYTSLRNKYSTAIGSIFNSTFKAKKHRFSWKNLYNLRYNDQYDEKTGLNYSVGQANTLYTNVTLQNKLIQTRLEGEHLLTRRDIKLDWSADIIELNRLQPHTRVFINGNGSSGTYAYDWANTYINVWTGLYNVVLKEKRRNASVNLTVPFTLKEVKQSIKIGYSYAWRSSDLNAASVRIQSDSIFKLPAGTPYYDIVTSENFRRGYLYLREPGLPSSDLGNAYRGTQTLHAIYAMVDLKPFKKFRLIGGVRNESNMSDVFTTQWIYGTDSSFTPPIPFFRVVDTLKSYLETDLLPSVNLVYSPTSKINIRAALSKTLARPEMVERSPYLYLDVPDQLIVTGQRGLEISRIKNFDLRFEIYPAPGEIFSASVFYKDFDKPVERLLFIGNNSQGLQFQNMKSAVATGFEIDLRKSLGFIAPSSSLFQYLTVSGNFSYIQGKVVDLVRQQLGNPLRDTIYEVKSNRPLQGLSPYIINAGISYDRKGWGLNLAYNRAGRKNITGGTYLEYTQFENPRNVLDFQANVKLAKQKIELKLNISDILNEPFIIYTNCAKQDISQPDLRSNNDPKGLAYNEELDFINYKVKKGTNISVNVTYKF